MGKCLQSDESLRQPSGPLPLFWVQAPDLFQGQLSAAPSHSPVFTSVFYSCFFAFKNCSCLPSALALQLPKTYMYFLITSMFFTWQHLSLSLSSVCIIQWQFWQHPRLLSTYLILATPLDFISSVQSLSHVRLFVTLWTAARQASLSITSSRSLLKLMSIESVMPSSRLSLCHPLLLPLSICPSIRVFLKESVLRIRWPKYWSFSISPSNEYSGLISSRMDWLDLLAVQGILKSLLQHHSSKATILECSASFIVQLSHPYMTTGKTIALTRQTFVSKVCLCLLICCLCWSQLFFQGASAF